MNKNILSSINIIHALYDQTAAILDLLQNIDRMVDEKTINMSAEMCTTMLDEIKAEMDKIYQELKKQDDDLK